MKHRILEIYAMAVCFVSMAIFAIYLGVAIYDLVEISYPEFTMSARNYERHQTNDKFTNGWEVDKLEKYTDDEITAQREKSFELELKAEVRTAVQSLIQNVIVVFIVMVVFIPHWILSRKARAKNKG